MSNKENPPTFFSTTLTLGNGERNYAYCFKFFDQTPVEGAETKPRKSTKIPTPPTLRKEDDGSHSPREMPKDHWKSNVSLYRQKSLGSDFASLTPVRSNSGTPVASSSDDELEDNRFFPKKRVNKLRRLERRNSTIEFSASSELIDDPSKFESNEFDLEHHPLDRKRHSFNSFSGSVNDLRASVDSMKIKENNMDSLYFTKAIVIISKFAYFQFFKEYLTQVYQYIRDKPFGKCEVIPIERYLRIFVQETLIVPPGIDIQLQVYGPKSPLLLRNPAFNDLPLSQVSLQPLLKCLDKRNLLKIFTGLTLERSILFTSNNPTLLYYASHGLLSLLYPLEWQTVYIPIVPPTERELEITQAPNPTVLGIYASLLDQVEVTSSVSKILNYINFYI